tara:strand:- start:785 stop:1801 length:1017 start_codon:yes stop_codon:yes gene_type:complete
MKLKILELLLYHFLFYILFYEFRTSMEIDNFELFKKWFELKGNLLRLSSFLVFSFYALGAYIVLYNYYKKSFLKVLIGLIMVFILVVSIRYFIEEIFYMKVFGFDNYYDAISPSLYVLGNLFYAALHISFGVVFFFIQSSKFHEMQTQRLLVENKRTELAFLRAQLNPHFLFNTLNNIYSLVYRKSNKALPALEKLTTILRYSLYESEFKIPLKKEINIIDNYINLEQMRYDYPLNIDFKINGDLVGVLIPPFLLLPIVENAFKHGDMKCPLKIHIDIAEKKLNVKVINYIIEKQKDEVGGLGLKNIKKRLGLIYGSNCELVIHNDKSIFDVSLRLIF